MQQIFMLKAEIHNSENAKHNINVYIEAREDLNEFTHTSL